MRVASPAKIAQWKHRRSIDPSPTSMKTCHSLHSYAHYATKPILIPFNVSVPQVQIQTHQQSHRFACEQTITY